MVTIELKAYTTRAKELEAAIHTQKNLMVSQGTLIKEQQPQAPQKKEVIEPPKPELHKLNCEKNIGFLFFIALLLFTGVCGLFCLFISGFDFFTIICLIAGVIGGICLYSEITEEKSTEKLNKIGEETYQKQCENYPKLLEEYRNETALADENYQKAMNSYNTNVLNHNQRYNETMSKHNSALSTLETALEQLYAENIIFPKYRNFVAISAINEYLLSGRCDKLEGPDGAYNLYEMELRQNIIISQLSSILDDLEQIKNNQFSLYNEIQKSNYTINEILTETREMKETTKLTTYFAGVTALAETSPKYYYGITS